MKSRRMLLGGAAATAALAGAGVAWWRLEQNGGIDFGANAVPSAFWAMEFDTPAGQRLSMSSLRGKPLLLNFWATWCPPCVEELPLLDSFYQAHRSGGWQVLGLAVDQPSAVRKWLQAKPLGFPVGLAGFDGTELSKSLGNVSGSLPFSVVFGASGEVRHRKLGQVQAADLKEWSRLA
jgi:thiol-disulfide isomerase/thioredoxin